MTEADPVTGKSGRYWMLLTMVYMVNDKESIRVNTAQFTTGNVALVACTLDAAWTCYKEGRPEQAKLLLEEIVEPGTEWWWLQYLPGAIRTPVVVP